ncbi:hypothetical protein BESB_048780 [Besnoitia besnoiti]|uniref:Glutaredoxin domain-containing protein n=1 Tax=Besnoitia besnoiti TaxID=94643 RepID=A0A2A9MKZ8_BESBE|nr:hypothetical protein BESB_048780 [Besnoitia besnoiti]PFH36686.1 hypothetical protein BESB_048780 [Besnoitia besnoiti]
MADGEEEVALQEEAYEEEAVEGGEGGEEVVEEEAGEEGEEVSGDVSAETEEGGEATVAVGGDGGLGYDEVPDTGEVAEIVLITTSLGSIRRQFFASQRLRNFLDCKGVVYIIIDSNRDTSSAKNLKDVELFKEWKANRILKATPETEDSADPEIIIPQVLVDGVFVGDEVVLQDFEEDGDLDWIFSRAACPACLHEKAPDAPSCPSCGVPFRTLIPPQYIAEGHLIQMLQGCPYNDEEATEEKERWAPSGAFEGDVDLGNFEDEEGEAEAEE